MNGSCWRITRKRELVGEWREKLEIIITTIAVVVSHSSHIKVVIYFFYIHTGCWIEFFMFSFFFVFFLIESCIHFWFPAQHFQPFLVFSSTNIYPVKKWVFFLFRFSFLRVVILIQFFAAFASWLALDSFIYFLFLYYRESYGISQKEGK